MLTVIDVVDAPRLVPLEKQQAIAIRANGQVWSCTEDGRMVSLPSETPHDTPSVIASRLGETLLVYRPVPGKKYLVAFVQDLPN